ncbi:hypothetical protein ACP275_14G040100 [Erythranthe tilingii]
MQAHHLLTLFLIWVVLFLEIGGGFSVFEVNSARSADFEAMVKRVCGGKKLGQCSTMAAAAAAEEEETMVDSESNKRVLLMQKSYISYDTLRRDLVPCDRPGASYYNCKGPGVANSYSRGCEIITRCARGD